MLFWHSVAINLHKKCLCTAQQMVLEKYFCTSKCFNKTWIPCVSRQLATRVVADKKIYAGLRLKSPCLETCVILLPSFLLLSCILCVLSLPNVDFTYYDTFSLLKPTVSQCSSALHGTSGRFKLGNSPTCAWRPHNFLMFLLLSRRNFSYLYF